MTNALAAIAYPVCTGYTTDQFNHVAFNVIGSVPCNCPEDGQVERTYGSCDMDCGAVATVPFRDMYEILLMALCQDCADGK